MGLFAQNLHRFLCAGVPARQSGGFAFAKALIGKRKRVSGVGESTYWVAKTRCELRKRFLAKSAKRNAAFTNAKKNLKLKSMQRAPGSSDQSGTG